MNTVARKKIVVPTWYRIEENDGQTPFMREETVSPNTLLLIITNPELCEEIRCLGSKIELE